VQVIAERVVTVEAAQKRSEGWAFTPREITTLIQKEMAHHLAHPHEHNHHGHGHGHGHSHGHGHGHGHDPRATPRHTPGASPLSTPLTGRSPGASPGSTPRSTGTGTGSRGDLAPRSALAGALADEDHRRLAATLLLRVEVKLMGDSRELSITLPGDDLSRSASMRVLFDTAIGTPYKSPARYITHWPLSRPI
jgi:hypothetical protein